MKMNKKLIIAMIAGGISVGGFAQNASAATGNAKAILAGVIGVTESTALNFGGIVNGRMTSADKR